MSPDWAEMQPLDGRNLVASNAEPIRGWMRKNLPPFEHERVTAAIAEAVANKGPFELEHQVIRPDGALGWTHSRAAPILGPSGEVVEWFGTARDVTDQKHAEVALRASEERFRRAVGIGTVGILFFRLDGRITDANAAFERMSGYTREELSASSHWQTLTPREHHGATARAASELAERGETAPYEKEMVRKDGSRWWGLFAPTRLSSTGRQSECVEFVIDVTQAKKAEEAVRERDERLQLFLGAAADYAVIISDPDDRVLEWLGGAEAITGWRAAEVFGKPVDLIFTPEDRAAGILGRETRRAAETGRAENVRWHLRKDGSRFYAEGVTVPLRGPAGELRGFGKVFRDATEKKLTEERLQRSHDTFLNLIQNNPFGVYLVDADFRLARVSLGSRKVFAHVTPLLGRDFAEVLRSIWTEPAATEFIGRFRHTLATGEPYVSVDTTARRADVDDVESYDWRIERVALPDGRHGVVCYFYDMTERRRIEDALKASEERLRTLVESCPFGMYLVDADFHIALMNRGSQDGAFANVRPVIGRPFDEAMRILWPEPVAADVIGRFRHTLESGEPYYSKDFVNPRADKGEVEGYEWELHQIVMSDGRPGVACSYYDSTKLRAAEAALREADRRKDDFLALLAHELRNPLAPLRNGLQVIRLAPNRDARERAQAMMDRQLAHMVRLIDDLLDVSRISRNKMELRRSRLLLSDVVSNAVETARPAIDAAAHELTVTLPDEPVHLDADLTRLAQVFGNLLSNSAKYTPPGGRIRLAAEAQDGHVVVTVSDTGIGIPEASLPTIFDMFSQVDRSIERSTGGLGIGLALVKGLVEMHGGRVTAMSNGQDRGSTFTVQLPRVRPSPVLPQPEQNRVAPSPGSGRRVLVVDDNVDSAESMAEMLKLLGYSVSVAHDGVQAVEAAERFRPRVILMDVGMPKMNGYEATRRLRESPWGKDVAVVALTGWGQEGDRTRSKEAGCDGHLVKPVGLADLQTLLAEVK